MPHYHYQALNAEQQPVTGEVTADSLSHALAQLEARGLKVTSIADRALATAELPSNQGENPFAISATHVAWQGQLAHVFERARELLPPLRAFAEELPPGRRRRQLESLIATLASDHAPVDAAQLQSLPGYWIPLLGAATASRDPGRILREFLRESQQAEELRRQWWLSLAYPLFLLGLAIVIFVAFSFLVIPIFREIFLGFGIRIPRITSIILGIAQWITSGRIGLDLFLLLLVGLGVWFGVRWLSLPIRHWWGDKFAACLGQSAAVARFAQFTADLLEAELETSQALRLAGLATGSGAVRRAAERVAAHLEGAAELTPVKNRRLLTSTVLYAVRTPQASASRIRLLREISANHAERIRLRLSWTRGVIEPLAILVIGLVVGLTALALFLPLFQLLQGLA